jgi:hypothetical protein
MLKFFLFIGTLLTWSITYAQNLVIIGAVFDKITNKPLSQVNVGVVGYNCYAITDDRGSTLWPYPVP